MMTGNARQSDLIDRFHHEHDHLHKLIEDLERTFVQIEAGDLSGYAREEALESAAEDLETALEAMLQHFNHEEEVFFVIIEQRFPTYTEAVAELVASHEEMYQLTRWLQRAVGLEPEEIGSRAGEILAKVRQLRRQVEEHNGQEDRVFEGTLQTLSRSERLRLVRELEQL